MDGWWCQLITVSIQSPGGLMGKWGEIWYLIKSSKDLLNEQSCFVAASEKVDARPGACLDDQISVIFSVASLFVSDL
jgi:hypothetical protein